MKLWRLINVKKPTNKTKTQYERITGNDPLVVNAASIEFEPVRDFMSFKDAQETLEYKWPKQLENALSNGSVRFHMVSPDSAKARMIYKPDVLYLKEILGI